jgi:hypothetical protein
MRTRLLTLIFLAAPRLALACPVCFGQNDSPLAKGVNMGVFFMLGIVAVMLGAFAAFFVHLSRRARLFDESASSGTHVPSEGTAQC